MNKSTENSDMLWMQRAIDLAYLGRGKVSPNPMVGCVIVHEERMIGEGWHQKYGEAHAEVNAMVSVQERELIPEASVYVCLEPCAHFGKTPPCVDLLLRHQVKRVIVSNTDPNPLVAGKGLQKLRNAGIEVQEDILREVGYELNKRFFTFHTKKRPYIILKWAETADGFMARSDYNSKWISNPLSRQLVHKWRSEEDAIMVGTRTAQYDNPQLTVRQWVGPNPLRIVLDKSLKLNSDLHLFDQQVPTICYNLQLDKQEGQITWVKLSEDHFLENIYTDLYERKIQSLIIEGGSLLLQSILEAGLWDEARVFKNQHQVFKEGIRAPQTRGKLVFQDKILDDYYFEYRNIS